MISIIIKYSMKNNNILKFKSENTTYQFLNHCKDNKDDLEIERKKKNEKN